MSSEKEVFDAGVLMGEIEQLLQIQYLNAAGIGAMVSSGSSSAHAALAITHAKGKGFSSEQTRLACVCHDELVRYIRQGLDLNAAVSAARHNEPSKAAFNQFLDRQLDQMEAKS